MKFALICAGLMLVAQQASTYRLGCGSPCGGVPCGDRCSPCGYSYGSSHVFEDERADHQCHKSCVPLVVRPQEIATPVLPLPASLTPVPGPCAIKKAIVKPAVLSKPVCHQPLPQPCGCGVSTCGGCSSHHQYASSSTFGGPSDCRPVLSGGAIGYAGVGNCAENQANCAPADAVSLALAYKMAQQQINHQSEDRLHFGFRKLPVEQPQRKIVKSNNIPEEQIFALNGQIVELKPVKIGCQQRTLEEEAAEDLLALENEEEEERYAGHQLPRKVSLGEIGYGPAKLSSPAFVDVPVGNVVETTIDSAADAASSKFGCGCGGPNCKVIAGNVVYKTVPKPDQICLPAVPIPDSCESAEIPAFSEEKYGGCTCSCVPVVTKTHHQACHKRSSVTIQKLCHH